jgi:hypothetical protein
VVNERDARKKPGLFLKTLQGKHITLAPGKDAAIAPGWQRPEKNWRLEKV